MIDLLPSNADVFEREIAALSAELDAIDPAVIETLWDAWRCPAALLPWLAWAVSVDAWDDGWAEPVKRQAIADSPDYHRIKGTVHAVTSALSLADRPFELTEWGDQLPLGRRGTSRVFVETTIDDVPRILKAVRPLVMSAKPKSRPIVFGAGELAIGSVVMGAGLLTEELVTVEPYALSGETFEFTPVLAAGLFLEELITVEALP
ncbi:phage tail protein I [Bosea sp. ANAM02]|uniref:phage tail protein I n=1 Tax=Bosea sp. ANAM02 TaxID=2020412 RepID=UPI00140EED5C|nr:phage tail protein I [Bosea sp. ANAM02]BCB18060.1 phage tail protein I [Bosea sp. ANAM02]